jgi:hypothetical protein
MTSIEMQSPRRRRGRTPPASVEDVLGDVLVRRGRRTAAPRVSIALAARAMHAPDPAAQLPRDLRELQDAIVEVGCFRSGSRNGARRRAVLAEPLPFGDGNPRRSPPRSTATATRAW